MITVRVSEVGGVFKEVEVAEGSTVETALKTAGANINVMKEIRVNTEPAELSDIVEHGDNIYMVPQIKGNR